MVRTWTRLAATLGTAALLTVGAALAADKKTGKDTPLAKIMKKIDAETKVVREGVKTAPKFKNTAREIAASSEALAELAKETRPFTEPALEFKKPQEKWTELADGLGEASAGMAKAAGSGDFFEAKRAWISLNNTCTNCHGAFRPSTEDDPF
jgi:cytochrome c556